MADFLFLMHATPDEFANEWPTYLDKLASGGHLRGGSAIGSGVACRKALEPEPVTHHLTGFLRIDARDIEAAKCLLAGNPVYEAGGTVEIRELPQSEQVD